MFQFATQNGMIEDTGLVTLARAKELWNKYKNKFIFLHENGENPEMCIWINCHDDCSYGDSIWFVDYKSIIKGGEIYNLQKQGE